MNIFQHITTIDIVYLVIALIVMILIAEYVRKFHKHPVDIVGHKKVFFTISIVLLTLSVLSLSYKMFNGGLNLSLEFTGGTMMEVGFADKEVTQDKIVQALKEYSNEMIAAGKVGLKEPIIQMISEPKAISSSEGMVEISFKVKKKDGSPMDMNLSGLTAPFITHFGKATLVSVNQAPNNEAEVTFLIQNREGMIVSSTVYNENTQKGALLDNTKSATNDVHYTFENSDELPSLIAKYSKDLVVEDLQVVTDSSKQVVPNKLYKTAIIRVVKQDRHNLQTDESNALFDSLGKKFGDVYMFKNESIGPSVGQELASKAVWAIMIALVLQLIYVTIRFNRQARYGLAADIALVHDVIIMFGAYALFGREFDSPFVAALLTVIGYSVMDSIVIFDRIRENLKLMPSESYVSAVNLSVNQTMTRSVNTLLTVLLTLACLYFFGGETLQNFSFALLVGCTVGAYSSIFLAAPIVVMIDDKVKREKKALADAKKAARAQLLKKKVASPESKEEPATEPEEEVAEENAEGEEEKVKTKKPSLKYKRRKRSAK